MARSDEWSQNFSTMFWGFFTVLDKTGLKVSCSGIFTIKKASVVSSEYLFTMYLHTSVKLECYYQNPTSFISLQPVV